MEQYTILTISQTRIYEYMQTHNGITTREAVEALGETRLSARIFEMKERGIPIKSSWETVKNRYGEDRRIKVYRLAE